MNRTRPYLLVLCLLAAQSSFAATQPGHLDLSPYAGKVVMVDFWASWCGPCVNSFPWMRKIQSQYADQGFQIIAVNVDRDSTLAQAFLRKHDPGGIKVVLDPQGQLAESYDLEGMPTTFLYDRNGQLTSSHVGFEPERVMDYRKTIGDLLRRSWEPALTDTTGSTDEH